ncbi:MAG: hypothetical protein ACYSVY_19050 [Planctomycetota bacterium]|jgi:hypothetical protein
MTAQTDNPEVSNATEIVRLIEAADAFGEPDNYTGKREAKRYHDGMPLEVSTNPMRPSEAWSVSMHNVSEGGLSFWSKRDVPTRTPRLDPGPCPAPYSRDPWPSHRHGVREESYVLRGCGGRNYCDRFTPRRHTSHRTAVGGAAGAPAHAWRKRRTE